MPKLGDCWGSIPIRRPEADHRYGRCSCVFLTLEIEQLDCLETVIEAEQDTALKRLIQE